MADQDRSKEKASKNHHSKHLKRSKLNHPTQSHIEISQVAPLSRTLHDTPLHETSHDVTRVPPPSSVSRVPPSNTSHVEPSHNTLHVPPPSRWSRVPPSMTSGVTPPPSTSHIPPSYNMSHAAAFKKSRVPPPINVTRPRVVPPTRISSTTPSTSASHVAPPTRTSDHDTPSPSIRGVISPSNSQPSHSEGAHTPRSSETAVASETQSNNCKRTLYLDGNGFLPSHPAAKEIGDIIKSNFYEAWPSWKKIHIDKRDIWFAAFKKRFNICPPDDAWARKNFEIRGAAVMKNNLNKVRTTMNRPRWIGSDVWNSLCNQWGTQEFKKKRIQAKTNRASDCGGFGGSLHTCGSITSSQHRANMVKFLCFHL
ncbi:proline-rich receptor-like protein kinase PERK8 isoform X4 [Vicia villosa]|uniref:proline-rich receptor-like protein kinase PERK8 isoform X4 n=1 Tax=Vicia villosa TaxID=3911 RepID=UPI00273BBA44|nr:proline-rich receptor-like protein kinase PERK8 isoform X4 [Vicia villosa]